MVIHPVSKHPAHELSGHHKARRAGADASNVSAPIQTDLEQEPPALRVQASQNEISDQGEANRAVEWIRTHIVTNFRAAVAVQGNLDPLRVGQLVEA